MPGALRDSLLILGLLLEQETDLEPALIMTDTAAYADTVFGLFWLLGYQFSLRLPISAMPASGASTGPPTRPNWPEHAYLDILGRVA